MWAPTKPNTVAPALSDEEFMTLSQLATSEVTGGAVVMARYHAGRPPVAQWIRATDFGSVGRGFESLRAGQPTPPIDGITE